MPGLEELPVDLEMDLGKEWGVGEGAGKKKLQINLEVFMTASN